MKLIAVTTVTLAALFQVANANFVIWAVGLGGGLSGNAEGWQVYTVGNDGFNCDKALDWIWRDSDDVSEDKYGVRCSGDGCTRGNAGAGIVELEMNFNGGDAYHWTYYKNRDGALVNLNGRVVGSCTPMPKKDFFCGLDVGRAEGTRKLHCKIAKNADDINGNRPS